MVKHRGLNLQKFVASLSWDQFERYFNRIGKQPGGWAWLNPAKLIDFLNDESQAEACGVIIEDFTRVNDLAAYVPFLLHACRQSVVPWDDDELPVAISMRLFLDEPEAFEYA